MRIGLLLGSLIAAERFSNRIFAPKDLFINLANELVKEGHTVFVYGTSNLKTNAKLISYKNPIENHPVLSKKDFLRTEHDKKILTIVRDDYEYQSHLISNTISHANAHNLDILHSYCDDLSHYFVKLSKIPVVFTIHDPVFPDYSLEYLRLKMFPNHNYISISNSQKRLYEKSSLGIRPIAAIHHGVDINDFEYEQKPEDYLLMIGRYIPEKGFDDGMRAAIKLGKKIKIASSNNYKETPFYKQNIVPFINNPQVEGIGFLNQERKNKILKKSRAFLFPIKWEEPFGMVMIESMATGTPVIAYAHGAVPEVIKDGKTGFIINPSNDDIRGNWIIKKTGFEGLVEAIKRIYSMPEEKYKAMRRAAREHVEKNFTVEKMTQRYVEVYKEIIKQSKTSSHLNER